VTAWVARILRGRGYPCSVSKPVATAARPAGRGWLSPDTERLAAAAAETDCEKISPWSFPDPVAPPVAARRSGVTLTLAGLVEAVRQQQRTGVPVLVEGVGGLLCPLTETETVADLAAALELPLVVVARRSLGTLNHTLLTVEAVCRRGLPLAGVVVNETVPPEGLADATNVEELRRRLAVPILAVVPHQADPAARPPAELEAVDWWGVCFSGRPGTP
jgi:dethiobiotin synthetase